MPPRVTLSGAAIPARTVSSGVSGGVLPANWNRSKVAYLEDRDAVGKPASSSRSLSNGRPASARFHRDSGPTAAAAPGPSLGCASKNVKPKAFAVSDQEASYVGVLDVPSSKRCEHVPVSACPPEIADVKAQERSLAETHAPEDKPPVVTTPVADVEQPPSQSSLLPSPAPSPPGEPEESWHDFGPWGEVLDASPEKSRGSASSSLNVGSLSAFDEQGASDCSKVVPTPAPFISSGKTVSSRLTAKDSKIKLARGKSSLASGAPAIPAPHPATTTKRRPRSATTGLRRQ